MPIGKQTMPMNKQISMNPADKIKSIENKLIPSVVEDHYKQTTHDVAKKLAFLTMKNAIKQSKQKLKANLGMQQ